MSRPACHPVSSTPARPTLRRAAGAALSGLLAAGLLTAVAPAATASPGTPARASVAAKQAEKKRQNVVTPGDFTGFGFDQCHTPEQWKMDRWLESSPFLAVGVYISGKSRACRDQPNLTPTWVRTQLARGWRILPITLGPQASCQPRFPRYDDDVRIRPRRNSAGKYAVAIRQGRREADSAVAAAKALGIAPGSTLWYDLEGFDSTNVACRESALTFLSGWTQRIRTLGYVSGVYSSASSGIKALDQARINRPKAFTLPDQIWIARWDGIANTSTTYISDAGWKKARVKQYRGGHDERWGGVTINIDSNYLDLGRGSYAPPETYCGGVNLFARDYTVLRRPAGGVKPPKRQVQALQCLLQQQGLYRGRMHGHMGRHVVAAANAWQARAGQKVRPGWSVRNWVTLLSAGDTPVLKRGSAGPAVRRLQRALVAASRRSDPSPVVRATGVFDAATDRALRQWQRRVKVEVSGVAGTQTWAALQAGRR